jgi:uncharacterized membrane protein YoaK (UPF0700 family)
MPIAPTPERRAADSLPSAALLAFTGGSLDAFLYLEHGKVFAGAMTGNGVLTGIAVLGHNWAEFTRHALPIVAFIVGFWIAKFLDTRVRHGILIGLAAEILGLTAASFLPIGFPDNLFIPFICLLAAYQITTFRSVDEYSYNSTFMTGNLRTMLDGLYAAFDPAKRSQALRQARDLALVVSSFILGAVAGGVLAPRAHNHTLWLPITALFLVLCLALYRLRSDSHAT